MRITLQAAAPIEKSMSKRKCPFPFLPKPFTMTT